MDRFASIPRETDTSLFTSHVSQALFIGVCLIGLILVVLVFNQNYKNWYIRNKKDYESETEAQVGKRSAKKDFFNSILVLIICVAFFIFLIISMGMRLFS